MFLILVSWMIFKNLSTNNTATNLRGSALVRRYRYSQTQIQRDLKIFVNCIFTLPIASSTRPLTAAHSYSFLSTYLIIPSHPARPYSYSSSATTRVQTAVQFHSPTKSHNSLISSHRHTCLIYQHVKVGFPSIQYHLAFTVPPLTWAEQPSSSSRSL